MMKMDPIKLQERLQKSGLNPVLFISDPNGDIFEFGTREELENEAEAIGSTATVSTARELALTLDFYAYEGPVEVRL
jgi:hypothetical protein